ncbi:hypothetical protein EDB19DRAFT_1905198 [Suillus lakei]|nr:hypothetical protein EDB19DRAFT_1905198 [Suillus lakei]
MAFSGYILEVHVKAMQPPSTILQMRISSNGAMCPPVVGNIASPSSPTVVQQFSLRFHLLILPSPIRPAHQYIPRPNPNMFWYLSHSMVWTLPLCRLTPSWTDIRLLLHVSSAKAELNAPHINSKDGKMLQSNWPCAGSRLYNMELGNLIVMPQAGDSSDDFTAELDTIEDTESESGNDAQDNEFDAWSKLNTLRMVLTVPQPDVPMHEVHKALEMVQQAYTAVQSELYALKKDHAMLQAAVPAHSRNQVLKKIATIDNDIARAGKMYAMLNYFWVMSGLFLTKPQPDIDPHSDTHWSSPEAKLNGAMAELYQCIPKALHKAMETYPQFGSVFTAKVTPSSSMHQYCVPMDPPIKQCVSRTARA